MKTIICAVLTSLATTAVNAAAVEDVHSARSMLPYCRLSAKQTMANTRNAMMYGQCFGVISGVVMMTEVLRQARMAGKAELDPALCVEIPGDTTILQAIDAVVKYGDAHPDRSGERFEILAFAAFREAWPCGK
jgi:hypothetical protein